MSRAARLQSWDDARRMAKARLPWMVFDYIDGAAGSETGATRARAALDAVTLEPRILRDVSTRDLSVSVFGRHMSRPFGIAPMGMCNLSAPGADLMLARLAARHSIPLGVSTVASTPLETMWDVSEGNAWFQLYFSGDGTGAFKLARRAQDAGFDTLILTVDVPEVGRRPRELRHGFAMPFKIGPRQFLDFAMHPRWSLATLAAGRPEMANFAMDGFEFDRTESRAKADWSSLRAVRDLWRGRLVVKGVMHPADARRLLAMGVDAVQVSTHGARQLDSAPAPILALPRIRAEWGDAPVFFDSGLRSGEDILKTLRHGADLVFLGRIWQFAIAAAGEEGLNRMFDVISQELSIAMAQTGLTTLQPPVWRDEGGAD